MANMPKTKFSQQLAHIAKGSVDDTLTDELAELVKAVNDSHKTGSITVTFKLKPIMAGNEVAMIDMQPTYKIEAPKPALLGARMFPTYDGDLLRRDPNQPELDLQQVPEAGQQETVRLDTDG